MKLTKIQTKAHDDAMALLSLSRKLTPDEVRFVYENYRPGATNNIGKGGIFFTPVGMARDLATFSFGRGYILDACAGIGVLAWQLYEQSETSNRLEVTCVEQNPEFFEIGKKLLPQATWIRGDMFDLSFVKSLGTFWGGISNPPYGRVPTVNCDWTSYKGPAHLMMAEILLRICEHSADMIIPAADCEQHGHSDSRGESGHYKKFKATHKDCEIEQHPLDTTIYLKDWHGAAPVVQSVNARYDEFVGNQLFKQLP